MTRRRFPRYAGACALAALIILLLVLVLADGGEAETPSPLVERARIGPWPGVSQLIGYQGRIWFANSVKFRNHNSADLHSFDPITGTTRYEAHLLSQDAGQPTVHRGLLFWPFEDPRLSTGLAEYAVTDGRAWHWQPLGDVTAFHNHAMLSAGDALYAATSAWRGTIQRSDDGGRSWRLVYEHPTPDGQVSRVTRLARLDGTVYAGLTAWRIDGPKLLRQTADGFAPVPGWPAARALQALTAWRGHLYAFQTAGDDHATWRTDGTAIERLTALDGHKVRDFAATADALWLITAQDGGGALWRSTDGGSFTTVQRFDAVEPVDLLSYGGALFLGALDAAGDGTLWGPAGPVSPEPPVGAAPLPSPPPAPPSEGESLADAAAALDTVLAAPERYRRQLVDVLAPFARARTAHAGAVLGARLAGPFPDATVSLFGGAAEVSAGNIARWFLLGAMAHNGHGRVPAELLAAPFTAPANRAEKYLDPPPAAMWAVARLCQHDDATLAALIARLDNPDDPPWLRGDVVGALRALTGERFGYDVAAWRHWWLRWSETASRVYPSCVIASRQ